MILILSSEKDTSTNVVVNWLDYYHAKYKIFYYESFKGLTINLPSKTFLSINDIRSVWFRRWNLENSEVGFDAGNWKELNEMFWTLVYGLKDSFWINHPKDLYLTKITQLIIAQESGLAIPKTIVTTKKKVLEDFYKMCNGRVITKAMKGNYQKSVKDQQFMAYTSVIDDEVIKCVKASFFPSQFQNLLEKDFEIRTFMLIDKFFSIAIFSQEDEQTKVDFRNYNLTTPNRVVPFTLPINIENKLKVFAKKANINSGSFDLIKTTDNEYIFLEVNPVGQFGMVEQPGNYHLHKLIAEELIKHDKESNN